MKKDYMNSAKQDMVLRVDCSRYSFHRNRCEMRGKCNIQIRVFVLYAI